jgi:hypothetical protein
MPPSDPSELARDLRLAASRHTLRHREAASLGRIAEVLGDQFSAADRARLAAAIRLLEKVATEL